ncbi:hypothetical protein Cantr_09440 [Candida viswanathii]|uniref:Uncharacterized protein n=1 Tax=Candida viswanathii TaxID=5486 RepID=A0A367Y9W7_9ASCO|nr:hypothetical protein Cantr_09440 [Candida viswanathii]
MAYNNYTATASTSTQPADTASSSSSSSASYYDDEIFQINLDDSEEESTLLNTSTSNRSSIASLPTSPLNLPILSTSPLPQLATSPLLLPQAYTTASASYRAEQENNTFLYECCICNRITDTNHQCKKPVEDLMSLNDKLIINNYQKWLYIQS